MSGSFITSVAPVVGPLGFVLTEDSLPPSQTKRWVSRRKAEVVIAVNRGLLSLEEACVRYGLSREEFASWAMAYQDFGLEGLYATRIPVEGVPRPKMSRRRV